MRTQRGNERRRSFRVAIDGTAFLWTKKKLTGHYALADISIGGCLLQHGPPCDMQHDYRLVLHVPQSGAMRLPVRVVRLRYRAGGSCDLGLCFTAHPPAAEDRIHDLVMQNLEREGSYRSGRVLVVHADALCRRRLCEAIRLLGYDVVEAATPLEAVWELENGPMDFHTAFVADALGPYDSSDIFGFISARYPGMRRILVDGGQGKKPASAHAVLHSPLSTAHLRKVMPNRTVLRNSG